MPLRIVNVVPATMSNETSVDNEPSIAVDAANPQRIAITTFTPDPASSGNGPIFVSTDGGANWGTVVCLPGGNSTFDSSIRFAGLVGTFYASILRADTVNLNILRSAFPPAGVMTQLISRSGVDQPWIAASWGGATERVFVTSNDGGQAAVQFSVDAATAAAPAGFGAALNLQLRTGSSRPSVRGTVHRSGRVYVTFIHVAGGSSDVVVMRDDNWGANGFGDLVDAGDGIAGVRVVTGVTVPPVGTLLGTQRVSSRIAIAVDPRDRRRVYLVWCDGAVTTASPFTLHVRRSDDGGATWTADLRTVANVTNPCLAVSVQGVVALMYQQLITSATGNRWSTVLERSTDMFATVATSSTLAETPPGATNGAGDLGDFANMLSVGKDFYGTFSVVNAPLNANFPSGVTFLRNADFATGNLRNVANTANVATSVDPFFMHWQTVEPHDDVFVRDWTDSAAAADDGAEPSLHPAFYTTPDVWNRRGTGPGTFPSDRPDNEDAGNGVGIIGNNWLFARIRRKAAAPAGSPDLSVTAHFLVSKLGTGSNYVDASSADPDVSFPDPDPVVTLTASDVGPALAGPFRWHLSAVSSTHLCAAVEISTPADPYVGASLRGRAPGWPDTDLEIVDDNNKAQRNMGLSTTPARESVGESILWAIIHNAATWRRDLELRIRWPIPRDDQKRFATHILVPGERVTSLREERRIVLRGMEPCENRWIGISMRSAPGKPGDMVLVHFDEMLGDAAINGFALGIRLGSTRQVALHSGERLRSVATRLAQVGKSEVDPSLLKPTDGAPPFPKTLDHAKTLVSIALKLGKDQFGISAALRSLRAVARKGGAARLVALSSLMETIDAHLTAVQLQRGDRADIYQTVRWLQAAVEGASDRASSGAAAQVLNRCRRFDSDWIARKANPADAVRLVSDLVEPLASLGGRQERPAFVRATSACLEASDDLDAFQKRFASLTRLVERAVRTKRA